MGKSTIFMILSVLHLTCTVSRADNMINLLTDDDLNNVSPVDSPNSDLSSPDTSDTNNAVLGKKMALINKMVDSLNVILKTGYIPSKTGNAFISVGTFFDYVSKVKPQDAYLEVGFLNTDIWNPPGKWYSLWSKTIGIGAGLFQHGGISEIDTVKIISAWFPPLNSDEDFRREVLTGTTRKETVNQGLYFESTFKLWRNIYFLAHSELYKTYYDNLANFEVLEIDTTIAYLDPSKNVPTSTRHSFALKSHREFYKFNGIGIFIKYDEENFSFSLKSVFGIPIIYDPNFYLIQFNIFVTNLGIKLGGEIRGSVGQDPNLVLYLTKEFTFEELGDLISK